MKGFITLHRSLLEWEWYNDQNTKSVFIHLLLIANFEDKSWRGIEIKRGQVVTSLENLAKSTSLTVKQIRLSLDKLKRTNEITIKTTNHFSLITLTNYNVYQDIEEKKGKQKEEQKTNKRQTEGKQRANKGQQLNNDNNDNNENNPLTPKGEKVIFKKFEGGIGELISKLSEESISEAKKKAAGFDIYYLMGIYINWIKSKGEPQNLNAAFPAWCQSYIKKQKN